MAGKEAGGGLERRTPGGRTGGQLLQCGGELLSHGFLWKPSSHQGIHLPLSDARMNHACTEENNVTMRNW